jgi:tetratricopeptide (TPR) repeat protein
MTEDRIVQQLRARAGILADLDRERDAVPLLLKALEITPDDPELLAEFARTLCNCGDYSGALRYADAAIAADPQEVWGYHIRCNVLDRMGDAQGALRAAREAVALGPEAPENLNLLANCLVDCRMLREAEATAQMLVSMTPDSAGAHQTLARVYIIEHRWDKAEIQERRALALDPTLSLALTGLGLALWSTGRRSEALECYHDALRLQPDDESAQKLLESSAPLYMLPNWQMNFGTPLIVIVLAVCSLSIWHAASYAAIRLQYKSTLASIVFLFNGYYLLYYPEDYLTAFHRRKLEALSPELQTYFQTHKEELKLPLTSFGIGFIVAVIFVSVVVVAMCREIGSAPTSPQNYGLLALAVGWIVCMLLPTAYSSRRIKALRTEEAANAAQATPANTPTAELEAATTAVTYAPDSPGALNMLFEAQVASQKVEEAERTVQRLQEVAPDTIQTRLAQATLELANKRWQRAEMFAREALVFDPASTEAMRTLARALLEQNSIRDAIICYYQIVQREPESEQAKSELDSATQRYSFPTAQRFVATMILVYLIVRLCSHNGLLAFVIGCAVTLTACGLLTRYIPQLLLSGYRSFREVPAGARSLITQMWRQQWKMQWFVTLFFLLVEFFVFWIVSEPILRFFHR